MPDTIMGLFVPTTDVFGGISPEEISSSPEELKNFLTRLRQNMNVLSIAVNLKDTGYYITEEIVNGQLFFRDPLLNSTSAKVPVFRSVMRKVIDFGALPNAATTSVAHGITITSTLSFTRIYGTATDPSTTFIPLPYASPTGVSNIELSVDDTNVNIITGSDRSGFTKTYIILEWIAD